jgi:hypothetical protein
MQIKIIGGDRGKERRDTLCGKWRTVHMPKTHNIIVAFTQAKINSNIKTQMTCDNNQK